MSRADRTLDVLLAKLAERPSFERLLAQYTGRYRLPREVVTDAVQQSFYKVLKFYAGKASDLQTQEQVERFLHTVIRNTLIDEIRRAGVMKFVEFDEDYVALQGGSPRRVDDDGDAGEPETTGLELSREESGTQSDQDAMARAKSQTVTSSPLEDARNLEDTMADTIDARTLIKRLLLQLDPKYRDVVVLLLVEWTPDEIRQKFGQNGYRMRVWARVKICRILANLASVGHELAERLHAQGGCHRILQSIRGGTAPTPA